jgi:alpha-1,3-glucan synthase
MLAATSFQITLLSGHNFQSDPQLYVLGGVFLLVFLDTMFRVETFGLRLVGSFAVL